MIISCLEIPKGSIRKSPTILGKCYIMGKMKMGWRYYPETKAT
jgi:hypothetical protein